MIYKVVEGFIKYSSTMSLNYQQSRWLDKWNYKKIPYNFKDALASKID